LRLAVAGIAVGAFGSLSISLGLIPTVIVFALVVVVALVIRSWAALSGALIGWGLACTPFFLLSFEATANNGPGSGLGPPEYQPFLMIAMGILITGLVVGLIGAVRHRVVNRG